MKKYVQRQCVSNLQGICLSPKTGNHSWHRSDRKSKWIPVSIFNDKGRDGKSLCDSPDRTHGTNVILPALFLGLPLADWKPDGWKKAGKAIRAGGWWMCFPRPHDSPRRPNPGGRRQYASQWIVRVPCRPAFGGGLYPPGRIARINGEDGRHQYHIHDYPSTHNT